MLSAIAIDDNWIYEADTDRRRLRSIEAFSVRTGNSGYSLRRSFWLDISDDCVNYVLYLDSAPLGTEIIVNNQPITRISVLPFVIDVTMYLMLEDNELVFQVPAHTEGAFAGLRLQPIACD